MALSSRMADAYRYFVTDYGDPRTQHWIGVRTPWLTLATMASYLVVIYKILPWYMKGREAFKLRKLLLVYNFCLSIYSIASFIWLGIAGWFWNVNYRCFPTDYDVSPDKVVMLNLIWYFWISKFIELLDTVFFVLRKKDNQLTLLHVYHHCSMIFNVWITIKICAVGHFTFVGLTNSFVHFPMYAYYGLSAIGPHMQKYLWWKKYITKIQLIQFILNILHSSQVFFNKCDVSPALLYISIFQSFVFLLLFLNFYMRAYTKKGKDIMNKKHLSNGSTPSEHMNGNGFTHSVTQNGNHSIFANGNHSYHLRERKNGTTHHMNGNKSLSNGFAENKVHE